MAHRSYLKSVAIAFVLIFVVYFMAVVVAMQSGIDYDVLSNEGFPALGTLVGGQWLGTLIALGGMASGVGLYSAVLLSVSRVPKVMSDDELLPINCMNCIPNTNRLMYRSSAARWW